MKIIKARWSLVLLVGSFFPVLHAFAEDVVSTNGEFKAVAETTIRLLEKGDAKEFANSIVASVEDWQSLQATNTAGGKEGLPSPNDLKRSVGYEQQKVTDSAKHVVETANRLGLDAARVRFQFKEARHPKFKSGRGNGRTGGKSLPWYEGVTIVLSGVPVEGGGTNKNLKGDYELTLGSMTQLPAGWKSYEGITWNHFPDGVVDERTQLETKISAAVAARKPIQSKDDPALAELGKKVLHFLRDQDEKVFTTEAMLTVDDIWSRMEKGGGKHPSRKELEEHWSEFSDKIVASARDVLKQSKDWGLDFTSAELKNVQADKLMFRGAKGSMEELEANDVTFVFTVLSNKKSNAGKSLSGEYIFSSGEAMRVGDQWKIQEPVRWEKLPDGVVDSSELKKLEFENYVAEHGTLPPGSVAPDVEFVRLDNGKKEKLSDYRGKVLVVDFWATWCGPCQQPMAELQTIREKHQDWKDRVKVISLSIDDTSAEVQKHLMKKGWTNTFNVWAGPGGWAATPPKQYRVTGVPTTYVIGKDGKIIAAGHPAGMQIPELISSALE